MPSIVFLEVMRISEKAIISTNNLPFSLLGSAKRRLTSADEFSMRRFVDQGYARKL